MRMAAAPAPCPPVLASGPRPPIISSWRAPRPPLFFFVLTTAYSALEKRIRQPDPNGSQGPVVMRSGDLERQTIPAVISMEAGKPVVRIAGKEVDQADLTDVLRSLARAAKKNTL